MICGRCNTDVDVSSRNYTRIFMHGADILRLNCVSCGLCLAINYQDTWHSLEEFLEDETKQDGWKEVSSVYEQIAHFVLSQIIYLEHEVPDSEKLESKYDTPDECDVVKLLWIDHSAAGFYSIKPKGCEIKDTMESYSMNTLDTAYIRPLNRRQGFGMSLIVDLVQTWPGEDVGFSKPMSVPMQKVLEKYLRENENFRYLFWEVERTGNEGNRKLLWFSMNAENKKRKHNEST